MASAAEQVQSKGPFMLVVPPAGPADAGPAGQRAPGERRTACQIQWRPEMQGPFSKGWRNIYQPRILHAEKCPSNVRTKASLWGRKMPFKCEDQSKPFNNSLAAHFLMCDDSRRKLRFTEEMKDTRRVSLWIKRKGCFWFLYTLMYLYLFIAKTLFKVDRWRCTVNL